MKIKKSSSINKNEEESINIINKNYISIKKIQTKKSLYIYNIFIISIIILNLIILIFENQNYRIKAIIKSRHYMDICLKGVLINNNTNMTINNSPKITVIIPVYNCQDSIKASVRSIQNQKFLDLEIILVNDLSTDNSLNIIKELQKEDKRIKIINNKKNMGTLYSRSMGVFSSRGKYILPLDNDDLFLKENLFDVLYNEAEKNNYDIVGFKAIRAESYNSKISDFSDDIFHDYDNNSIFYQPELSLLSISKNDEYFIRDVHIWGKCIKTSLYKNATNAFGEKRYSTFMIWAEDTSMVFVLFNFAQTFKFLWEYGIFHFISEKTASCSQPSENNMFGDIFTLDIYFDFTKNTFKDKKYVVSKVFEIRNSKFFDLSKKNRNYLKEVFKKIMDCKYINDEDKLEIKEKYHEFDLFNNSSI